MIHLSLFTWLQLYTTWYNLLISIEYIFQVIGTLHCVLQLSKKLNNDRNHQEHAHKTMWKKYASLQSEAELCAIFKKKDYENKRGSHSFKDVLIILLACVSKTTTHLLWRQKETQKSDLKFLELAQTLLFISQYCDSFVILFATWNGTPRDKKNSLVKSFPCTRFLTLYEQGARRSPKWTFFSPLNPKVTSISLLPTVSTHNQQER